MHFLCLHGLGTNSQVLETQTATIRYELDQYHTYDFVEGTEICDIAPEIKAFYPFNDTYFRYHDNTAEGISRALLQLHTYIIEEGPFDGVIGFSQGAALAATYLIQRSQLHPSEPPPFRCAMFFSSSWPYDVDALERGLVKLGERTGPEPMLSIPTTHIWGNGDITFKSHSEYLCSICNENVMDKYVHEGGHEIPGARVIGDVQRCVRALRRTIDKASVDR